MKLINYCCIAIVTISMSCFAGEKRIKIDDQPQQQSLQDLPHEMIDNIIKQTVVSNFNEETKIESLATSIHNLHSVMRALKATNTLFKDSLEDPLFINSLVKHIADTYDMSQAFIALTLGEPVSNVWFDQTDLFPFRKELKYAAVFEIIELLDANPETDVIPRETMRNIISSISKNNLLKHRLLRMLDGNYIFSESNRIIGIHKNGSLNTAFGNEGYYQLPSELTILDTMYPVGANNDIAMLVSKKDSNNQIIFINQSGNIRSDDISPDEHDNQEINEINNLQDRSDDSSIDEIEEILNGYSSLTTDQDKNLVIAAQDEYSFRGFIQNKNTIRVHNFYDWDGILEQGGIDQFNNLFILTSVEDEYLDPLQVYETKIISAFNLETAAVVETFGDNGEKIVAISEYGAQYPFVYLHRTDTKLLVAILYEDRITIKTIEEIGEPEPIQPAQQME